MLPAILVALALGIRIAKNALKILPPSIGNAGMRLKSAKTKLAEARYSTMVFGPILILSSCSKWVMSNPVKFSTRDKIKNIPILTKGPAMATQSSCFGSSGNFSSLATPPIGYKTMSLVWIPYYWAAMACPNS